MLHYGSGCYHLSGEDMPQAYTIMAGRGCCCFFAGELPGCCGSRKFCQKSVTPSKRIFTYNMGQVFLHAAGRSRFSISFFCFVGNHSDITSYFRRAKA